MSGEPGSGPLARSATPGPPGSSPVKNPRGLRRRGTPRFVLQTEGHGPRINLRLPLVLVAMVVGCAELVLYPVLRLAAPRIIERHVGGDAARIVRELPAFPLSQILGAIMRGGAPLEVSVQDGNGRFHLRLG